MDKLFIPTKLRVGYQKRDDTYTKRLAYVIYYDSKGKLRKEKSFDGWRDKKIKVDEFDNKPHSGFMINKGVQRYGQWNNSGRNMVRVYDDRGIEFEISVDNLIFVLMTTDCLKRGLEGEFVYAWYGAELILLPTGCEEYAESQDFTSLQSKKIGSKDMIPGCSYRTKKAEDVIYLGRFDWFEEDYDKANKGYARYDGDMVEHAREKQYIFYQKGEYREIFPVSGLSSIASINSDVPVSNYATLMDKFNAMPQSSRTVGFKDKPYRFELKKPDQYDRGPKPKNERPFIRNEDGTYTECYISSESRYNNGAYVFEGFSINKASTHFMRDGQYRYTRSNYEPFETLPFTGSSWNRPQAKTYTENEVRAIKFVELYVVLANGKEINLKP